MGKKNIISIVVLIVVILFCINKYQMERLPGESITEISYCKEIAGKINKIDAKQMFCVDIEEVEDVVRFCFLTKRGADKDRDECMKDLILYRNYVIEYLKTNPYHDLNNKKIELVFQTIADWQMKVYNYDFFSGKELESATDFVYYKMPSMEHISIMAELTDTRVMDFVGVGNIDDMEFFAKWDELEFIYFYSQRFTQEEMKRIRELLPNCVVGFAQEDDSRRIIN